MSTGGDAAKQFWDEFRGLYQAAGAPTLESLVRLGEQQAPPAVISDTALSEWLNRKGVPSRRNSRLFLALVAVLQSRAEPNAYEPRPEWRWRQLLARAQDERRAAQKAGRPRRPAGPDRTSAWPGQELSASLPPVVGDDRGDLAALTLQPAERLSLIARHLDPQAGVRRSETGQRQALFVLGEGGIGKSVLLGQYLDHLEATGNRGIVLVSCGSIEPAADLGTLTSADLAFGAATGNRPARKHGLLALLNAVRGAHGMVSLLIDTLDLRISEGTLVPVVALISEALEIGDVVVTCRTQEYESFLRGGARRLVGRIDPVTMPVLSQREIVSWAENYLEKTEGTRPGDQSAFLQSLCDGVERSRSLREVCSLPVRLALTCQTFVHDGHVPPELTITGLFERYWDTRIARHAELRGTAQARVKEAVTLQLAAKVVQDGGRVVLRVPLKEVDEQGRDLLASEGVVRVHSHDLEFFHQTFAEYAHARWLLSEGVTAPSIQALRDWVFAGNDTLWAIVTSLLLQVRDFADYQNLASLFPVTTAQGARARAFSALRRPEPTALTGLLTEAGSQPELIPAMIDVLEDAPYDRLPEAYSWITGALRAHPARLAKKGAAALASLLPRLDPADIPAALAAALNALSEAEGQVANRSTWTTLSERIVLALSGHSALRAALPVLRQAYSHLGERGQQATLRAHLALRAELSRAEVVRLAECALATKSPELHDGEAVELISLFWNEPGVRDLRRWDSLPAMVNSALPGGWQNGQVKFAVQCAETDQGLRAELFSAALRVTGGHPVNNVSAIKQLAALFPQWSASWLLAQGSLGTARLIKLVNAIAVSLAAGATSEQRGQIAAGLRSARGVNPRDGFCAEIVLAGERIAEHREILLAVEQARPAGAVLGSVLDTWLFRTPAQVRTAMADELRRLLASPDPETRQRRARLEAFLAVADPASRNWISTQVLAGQSSQVASTAVTSFGRATVGTELDAATLQWLTSLLASRHTEATRSAADLIADKDRFSAATVQAAAPVLTAAAVARLRAAVDGEEASQTKGELLKLLIRVHWAAPLPADVIVEVFTLIQRRLEPVPGRISEVKRHDQNTAITDLRTFVGQVMARSLARPEVFRRVGEVLAALTDAQVQNNARSTVVTMLKGLGHDDLPATCTWMRNVFVSPGTATGVRLAIAEAMLDLDGDQPGGRADALVHEPACPVEVATYLQKCVNR
jgi:hypothetical protein